MQPEQSQGVPGPASRPADVVPGPVPPASPANLPPEDPNSMWGSAPSRVERPVPWGRQVGVRFQKKRLWPLKRYGAFRGDGTIEITPDGLVVEGRHVLPLAIRLVLYVVGVGLGYLLGEYVILVRSHLEIPWSVVRGFVADAKEGRLAIETDGSHHVNPVVFHSSEWQAVHEALRVSVPTSDRGIARPAPKKRWIVYGSILAAPFVIGMIWVGLDGGSSAQEFSSDDVEAQIAAALPAPNPVLHGRTFPAPASVRCPDRDYVFGGRDEHCLAIMPSGRVLEVVAHGGRHGDEPVMYVSEAHWRKRH